MKSIANLLLTAITASLILAGCSNKTEKMEQELKAFITTWEQQVEPLQKEAYTAYWNASLSGRDEDYARSEQLQLQLSSIYTSKDDFALLKKIKESGAVQDTLLKRQLEVLYTAYLSNQIDTALLAKRIKMEVEIEKKYSNFRAEVNGRTAERQRCGRHPENLAKQR